MLFVPLFLYFLDIEDGSPYWPSSVSRNMRKSAENRPPPGNVLAGAQNCSKMLVFHACSQEEVSQSTTFFDVFSF